MIDFKELEKKFGYEWKTFTTGGCYCDIILYTAAIHYLISGNKPRFIFWSKINNKWQSKEGSIDDIGPFIKQHTKLINFK